MICDICKLPAIDPIAVVIPRNEHGYRYQQMGKCCSACFNIVIKAETELALYCDWFDRHPNINVSLPGKD